MTDYPATFEEFVQACRDELSITGLPLNCQPPREYFHPFFVGRVAVAKAVADGPRLVAMYEAQVNKDPTIWERYLVSRGMSAEAAKGKGDWALG